MPNPYRTGPSDMSQPLNTPPSSSFRTSLNEPRGFRQSLFGGRSSMEDDIIRRAANITLGGRATPVPPQPMPAANLRKQSQLVDVQQRPPSMSNLPSPAPMREPPRRRGSGAETKLVWEDPRTRREVSWQPFDVFRFWQAPGWLSRCEAVDQETLTPEARVQVVSEWRSATGPLAKAIEQKRVPPSRLRRLHVEMGSPVVVLGIFKLRDEIFIAAYSLHRVAEAGICAYGLLPISTVSVSGRKPEMQAKTVYSPLHESAFGFTGHAQSYSGLVPIEGVVMGEPTPAIQIWRTDEESSPLQGPSTAVMTSDLQRVVEARKRAEVREVRDNFGAFQRQPVWVFEYKAQGDLGSDVKELFFFDEGLANEVMFGVKQVSRGVRSLRSLAIWSMLMISVISWQLQAHRRSTQTCIRAEMWIKSARRRSHVD